MAKKELDLSIYEDKSGVYPQMVFEVTIKEEHYMQRVPLTAFNRCCKDLDIASATGIFNMFEQVCDWFIKESQYIKFEEVIN